MAQPFVVEGASMEPNFSDGDYILIDEITYRFREPERGDVVVFKNPRNESEFYIKRIIGLPGEEVVLSGNLVKINGVPLNESYLPVGYTITGELIFNLDDDEYFVMGDNRLQSFDSRSWGPLKRNEIIGTVRLRFWPFNKIEIFRGSINHITHNSKRQGFLINTAPLGEVLNLAERRGIKSNLNISRSPNIQNLCLCESNWVNYNYS